MSKHNKILKELKKASKKYKEMGGMIVKVGVPDDRFHGPSGLRMSELGIIHEFGLGNMPERSFLRAGIAANKQGIKTKMNVIAKNIKNGAQPRQQFEALALYGQGVVQQYIADGIQYNGPPKPDGGKWLIETGELRQSIIGIVEND